LYCEDGSIRIGNASGAALVNIGEVAGVWYYYTVLTAGDLAIYLAEINTETGRVALEGEVDRAYEEAMPSDPFPNDPWNSNAPGGKHWQPVPLPWLSKTAEEIGTPDGVQLPPGPSAPSSTTPDAYLPPPGVILPPVPPVGTPPSKLGDGLRSAADALHPGAGIDMLAWVKAPLEALMRALADFMDWLGSIWDTITGWFTGLFWPGAAAMSAHFGPPFTALQTALATHWPFAAGPLVGLIGFALVNRQAATQTLPDSWTINFFGAIVTIHLADWTAPLIPYRWVFTSTLYLWVLVSMWRFFKPKVSM
jgi:hypothetical protein